MNTRNGTEELTEESLGELGSFSTDMKLLGGRNLSQEPLALLQHWPLLSVREKGRASTHRFRVEVPPIHSAQDCSLQQQAMASNRLLKLHEAASRAVK